MYISTSNSGRTINITIPDAAYSAIQQGLRLAYEYPRSFALILLVWSFYPEFPFDVLYRIFIGIPKAMFLSVVWCLGFMRRGVARGSYAADYQSGTYGAYTPANSYFSRYQSYGALNTDTDTPRRRSLGMSLFGWGLFLASIYVFLDSIVHERNPAKW
ncbi:hypothetical protein AMATHDRAFT_49720 [Amanita thiersii Skay4041]|uniref:Uncharacterized protein n=1 Tax=Amanita thiersii Skay4041 TaxID=703135 RepID=A0A2A9NIS2_9AGAR|nr:hypothetical protein AMATHDRAFT_49720 [Amanita thiersii Skay4041]